MIDAGSVARALRTSSATRSATEWIWPHWLERQLDPTSPSFVSPGPLPLLTNVTARNWTMVGNVGSSHRAIVDPRGLVTPWVDGWSLDWWIGAEDRWHLPSREPAVRQRLIADAPVVETAMRVPGGDILHRVYAIRSKTVDGAEELVVVELENATPVPVALALAIRPYNPEGTAAVDRIDLHGRSSGTPDTVTVDGRVAVLLPRAPHRMATSTGLEGDVSVTVLEGRAGTSFPPEKRCEDGLATAAFVYPLPHRATMSFLVPLTSPHRPGRRPSTRRRPTVARRAPSGVPTATQVANGWRSHAVRGVRLVLPDARLAAAVEANRRFLLLAHDGAEIGLGRVADRDFHFGDAAHLLRALDRYGYADEVTEVLASYPDRQRGDGSFDSRPDEREANGAALHAVGEHWRLHRDPAALAGLAPVVAACVESIGRRRSGTGPRGQPRARSTWAAATVDGAEVGLAQTSEQEGSGGRRGRTDATEAGSPADRDDVWHGGGAIDADEVLRLGLPDRGELWDRRGLLDAAEVLDALSEGDAAAATRAAADRIPVGSGSGTVDVPDGDSSPAPTGRARRTDAAAAAGPLDVTDGDSSPPPAGGARRTDPAVAAGSLDACWPLHLVGADDRRIIAIAEEIRQRSCVGAAVFERVGHRGLDTHRTLQLAFVELQAGDRRALDRLDWLLSAATPTWTWPELVHPRLDAGSSGEGHDVWVGAGLLLLVRDLLVRETSDGGLAVCSLVPPDWLGQQLEVHDAPTHHGSLSFAVRWHGDRPALLWELVPHEGAAAVRITAPGLDPSWSTTELRGDALLAPVAPPSPPEPEPEPEPEPGLGTATPPTPVRLTPRRSKPTG